MFPLNTQDIPSIPSADFRLDTELAPALLPDFPTDWSEIEDLLSTDIARPPTDVDTIDGGGNL